MSLQAFELHQNSGLPSFAYWGTSVREEGTQVLPTTMVVSVGAFASCHQAPYVVRTNPQTEQANRAFLGATWGTPCYLAPERLCLAEVRVAGQAFILRDPIEVDVHSENGGWCYVSKALGIIAFGGSEQEALGSFLDDFAVLWNEIALSPNESLTGDAIAVKEEFLRIVDAVNPE